MNRNLFDTAKRLFDIVVSVIALAVSSPLLFIIAVLVRRRLGSPVLFRQGRPGLGGETFRLLKFRSMVDVNVPAGFVSNEERMTKFGKRLRASSLDELPSFWNILRGEMSIVGPRPLLIRYLPLYSSRQLRRHEVRPGLTGLAQVSGRNALEWRDRLELDVKYVEDRSWCLDLWILCQTVVKVFRRDGIASEGHAVGAPFVGNEERGEK